MNPRYHEIHRIEIKRRLYRSVDQQWDALFGAFTASIVLAGFGVSFFFSPMPGSWIIGLAFFFLSALLFAIYRWLFRTLRNRGIGSEWLNMPDQLIVVSITLLAIFLSNSSSMAWLFIFPCACAYGSWRLRQNLRVHLRRYYFREAREYIREIEGYNPRPNRPTKLETSQ